jgi:hypothetical protein
MKALPENLVDAPITLQIDTILLMRRIMLPPLRHPVSLWIVCEWA